MSSNDGSGTAPTPLSVAGTGAADGAGKPPSPLTPARGARHRVERVRERARYDRGDAYAILDAGWFAHVGFAQDGQPVVIPMLYAREQDTLLLHGSIASRLLGELSRGIECCVTVTHLDGLVLARSHFHHSVNYRSVVAFGRARVVDDAEAKAAALHRFVDALLPGRAADTRPGDAQELAATRLLAFEIVDVSAKIRAEGVHDHPDDMSSRAWAGVLPLTLSAGAPQPDAELPSDIAYPPYLSGLSRIR